MHWNILVHLPKEYMNKTTQSHQRDKVFHSFYLMKEKNSATTTVKSKCLIEILEEKKVLTSSFIAIWENNYGCDEQYRCASALCLM